MELLSATVVGMGRVGTSLAAFLASKNVHVYGVEQDARRREMISGGCNDSNEPGLANLYARYRDRIQLTDLATAVCSTRLSFIVVPTPSAPDGSLSYDTVREVVRGVTMAAASVSHPHVIVVVSTVLPGTIRGPLTEILRLHATTSVSICYSPVFVALGSILSGLESPPFVLIGTDDKEAGDTLAAFYNSIGYPESLLARTDTINAEIAKLTLNAFLATKIAFANSVGAICESIPGGDVASVLAIIGRDWRVGNGYLRGGTPYGGPCLPRDNEAFIKLAETHGVEPIMARAVKESNRGWYASLLRNIVQRAPHPRATFGVIGLTYKPDTDYLDDGFGLSLARDLAAIGYKVLAYDPCMRQSYRQTLSHLVFIDDINELVKLCDVCVLTHPDNDVASRIASAATACKTTVVDTWPSGVNNKQ